MGIAIITGASSGIGKRFAEEIKKTGEVEGFLLIARRQDRLEALKTELGMPCDILPLDLSKKEGLDAVRAYLAEKKPAVKYLVNAAGYGVFGDFLDVSEADTEGMIDLNVKALVMITYAVLPYMTKDSHVLEMGSGSVFTPLPHFNIYASSKAFVYHFSRALAREVKKDGVFVTVLCPGWVKTEFFSRAENEKSVGPKKKTPMLDDAYVVKTAMRAMKKKRILCTCNWYTKLQHLLSKLLPSSAMVAMWEKMCR